MFSYTRMLGEYIALSAHRVFIHCNEDGNLEVRYSSIETCFIMTEWKGASQAKFVHAVEVIGSEICCLPSKYFTLRLPRIHTKKRGTWGLFLKSPETFRVSSGATIPFISSQRRGSKPSNFAVLLIFLTLKTCKKIIFSKQADCSLTTNFSGPKSSRDFRETGPSWSQDLKIPVSRPEINLTVFDLDHVNQWLA